jgi:prepilin-type N-terminal cleavage/methylation domain-containing protein
MKNLRGKSKGITLLEVLVALALLGIIAVAFLSGLSTALKAVKVSDMHSTAQSLATSQLEYVKSQDYDNTTDTGTDAIYSQIDFSEYSDYFIRGVRRDGTEDSSNITGIPFDPNTGVVCGLGNDMGIQNVTIKVYHSDKLLFTLTDYKIDLQ